METDSEDEYETDSTSNDDETPSKSKEMDKKKRSEFTSIILDAEMKELIIRESKTAQDPNHQNFIANHRSYEIFHNDLKDFMNKKYGKTPTQTDNLAYLLLLGYPEHMVRNFTSMKDLKLAFTNKEEESDFKPYAFFRTQGIENTCICNKPICDVHIFQNIHSGINFNIGSKCNNRYGLISKTNPEYKSNEKKLKEYKENEKEKREGLPEGYYKQKKEEDKLKKLEEKKIKKELKEELRLMSIEEKLTKKNEAQLIKELKNLNKHNPNSHSCKKCYSCKKDVIFNNIDKILLCSICCPQEQKIKKQKTVNSIKYNSKYCLKCNYKFYNNKGYLNDLCNKCYYLKNCKGCYIEFKGINELCCVCDEKWCLEKCKMCPKEFLKNKKTEQNNQYCPDCEDNLINCIDCKREIFKPSERCSKCHHMFINKITVKICDYCDHEFEVKEDGKWKTCCSDCYSDNRKLEKCQDCNDYFKKMKNENWRIRCRSCYYKNKNKV